MKTGVFDSAFVLLFLFSVILWGFVFWVDFVQFVFFVCGFVSALFGLMVLAFGSVLFAFLVCSSKG